MTMMTARTAVATALSSAISSSGVRALISSLIAISSVALKCGVGRRHNSCMSGRSGRQIVRDLVYCGHDSARRRLMHHMACSGNAVKGTLNDVGVKAARLFIDVD